MTVTVLGSINMDLVTRVSRFPLPGETLIGQSFFTVPGGKGANQAVAAARLGVPTHMIGRVGDDAFGEALRNSLNSYSVETSNVFTHAGISSGVAIISVDDNAENNIIAVPGANGMVNMEDIVRLESVLPDTRVLLLQLEIPLEIVKAAMELAHRSGVTVILDPAPVRELPLEIYPFVDIITPNESEAAALVGFPILDVDDARRAAEVLRDRGIGCAIIKMGSKGVYYTDDTQGYYVPAFKVKAIDTVAAGDAFNGGLAVALSESRPFDEAIRWGLTAGAISVTRQGAQPSMPTRNEVEAMLMEEAK
jgi:ribokinase